MNILVTGGAGFIGSHLCERLLDLKNVVYCIDNLCDFYKPSIKIDNLENSRKNENFHFFKNDIRNREFLEKFFKNNQVDLIIHLAAMAGVRPSIQDPQLYTEVNINGTVNLLEMAKKHNIMKFIFASSSSVYGNNKKVPFAEEDVVDFPISPYAATKKAGELLCHTYHSLYNISMACLRFFTVYGPRQRPDLAIHKFTNMIMDNEPLTVYGDGSSKRDYTFIEDILDGICKTIDFVKSGNKYEIFNLGESQTISLHEMIDTIENAMKKKVDKIRMPMQPGDVNQTFADISKSKKILGYNPKTKFKDGIEKFVTWKKRG